MQVWSDPMSWVWQGLQSKEVQVFACMCVCTYIYICLFLWVCVCVLGVHKAGLVGSSDMGMADANEGSTGISLFGSAYVCMYICRIRPAIWVWQMPTKEVQVFLYLGLHMNVCIYVCVCVDFIEVPISAIHTYIHTCIRQDKSP
jgi:hypothetical protein